MATTAPPDQASREQLLEWYRTMRTIRESGASRTASCPPAHAEALAGRARVELLAGAGHSPHMEAANEVNRLVGAFLDEQDPT
jgi:pimeloyl-ACP methyl ester carboxylesterase